jgi:hypothetical protein
MISTDALQLIIRAGSAFEPPVLRKYFACWTSRLF